MEFNDREPIYRQIANDLRRQIVAGVLAEGDRIMSTNEYAAAYRINPATAAKAFAELVADGLVERRRGIGMFVAPGARAQLQSEGREHYLADTLKPAVEAGVALGLSEDEILRHIKAILAAAQRKEAK
ncbi:GntR family transcriptional regulator [Gulosibacter molinativorax]|uniref:GntR family transcriptional regulator n=1 Tax=Gulosibacter molinativorax TaxID=256821 RepID=UPI000411306C|nr:GntR family transcriptional regulator [Gulosibacter molinativorax]QUY60943.1 GntR family transcriptional regulator [Gulosibacter molinativorax]